MLIYNLDILHYILECFKVNDVIITSLKDVNLVERILEYDASFFAFDSNVESNFNQNNLDIITDVPLNILPKFENYDAIFINDDPNWYTIYSELNIIKDTNEEFPLVFICNDRFPNKRRDAYVNLELIPDEFKHEFVNELPICYNGKKIIISDGNYHACEENTDKNGVLTAIEDFLSDNNNIGIMDISFTEGITILYSKSNISKIRLSRLNEDIQGQELDNINFSDKVIENEVLFNYIDQYGISQEDLESIDTFKSEISQKNKLINDYENKFQIHDAELDYKEGQIDNIKSKLSLKDSQIDDYKSKLFNKNHEIDKLQSEIRSSNKLITDLENEITARDNDFQVRESQLNNQLDDAHYQIKDISTRLEDKDSALYEKDQQIRRYKKELSDSNHELENKNKELSDKEKELRIEKQNNMSIKHQRINSLNEIESNKYCISCFKEEISNNHLEIQYLKSEGLSKKLLSFLTYFILVLKSHPREISINFKLYKLLKNSKCFDIGYYLNNNEDIQNSNWCKYFSPELHYVCVGFNEKRKFNKKYYNRSSKKELLEYVLNCQ